MNPLPPLGALVFRLGGAPNRIGIVRAHITSTQIRVGPFGTAQIGPACQVDWMDGSSTEEMYLSLIDEYFDAQLDLLNRNLERRERAAEFFGEPRRSAGPAQIR